MSEKLNGDSRVIDLKDVRREKFIEEATEKFRRDFPRLVEGRIREAERVGESFPSLEEIYEAAESESGDDDEVQIRRKPEIKRIK